MSRPERRQIGNSSDRSRSLTQARRQALGDAARRGAKRPRKVALLRKTSVERDGDDIAAIIEKQALAHDAGVDYLCGVVRSTPERPTKSDATPYQRRQLCERRRLLSHEFRHLGQLPRRQVRRRSFRGSVVLSEVRADCCDHTVIE